MSWVIEETPGMSYERDDVVALASTAGPRAWEGLNDSAALLVQAIERSGEVDLGTLSDVLTSTYGLDPDHAFNEVATFVHRAQVVGALSMRSSWVRQVRYSFLLPVVDLVLFPMRLGFPERGARREYRMPRASSTAHVALTTQGALALVLGIPFAAVLWLILQPPYLGEFLLAFGGVYVLTMMVTGLIHELAHFAVARVVGKPVVAVFRERFTVGLKRDVGRPAQELAITIAGPVAALVVLIGLLLWLATGSWDAGVGVMVQSAILGVLAALSFHLGCLLPPSADGQALVAAAKGLRR